MNEKYVTIRSIMAFAVWTSTTALFVAYYSVMPSSNYKSSDLESLFTFVVISFVMPFVLCKIFDILLRNFGYIVKGTVSILVVFLVGSLLLISVVPFNREIIGPRMENYSILLEFSVPWILVVIVYYGLQSSQERFPKSNSKSRVLESELSFVDFGSEALYQKINIPPKAAALAAGLHRRADLLIHRANTVLVIIVAVLLFTAVFIIFAGQISKWGTTPINHLSNMITERNQFGFDNNNLRSQIKDINKLISKAQNNQSQQGEFQEDLKNYEIEKEEINTQIRTLEGKQQNLDDNIQRIRESLIVGESDSEANQNQSDKNIFTQLLLAAGITRFGVVIIAIYLVQILSNLYRYNIQTAAHYRAIADFLILANPKDYEKIKSLDGALLPDIGFSKAPKMISQKITKSVVEALERFIPKLRHSVENSLRDSEKSKQPRESKD